MSKTAAIIPAGGAGLRMGGPMPKQFCDLAGIPILAHTVRAFEKVRDIDAIILVVPDDYVRHAKELIARHRLERVDQVVTGGRLRQDSVRAGLEALPADVEYIVVHDGARPLVTAELIGSCLAAAQKFGAAIAALPVKDTLKAVSAHNTIEKTVDRRFLWQAQTPQAMRASLLRHAFAEAAQQGFTATDEAQLLENIAAPVAIVNGSERNIKITRPEDLPIAEALLMRDTQQKRPTCAIRIGHGYDAHRLAAGRPLILGGVTIPHPLGLLGHSDADVLIHALCDAVLGAVCQGDIGRHFPDTDPQFKGASSIGLLEKVMGLALAKGYHLLNADVTIIAQQPKLAPYLPEMQKKLAAACQCQPLSINLKASTTEKMGFTGREEGMAAHAVVLLEHAEG